VSDYYARRLSGERLRRCYQLAPPRVQRYLQAEIEHACRRLAGCGRVLELGCGYGRVLRGLGGVGAVLVGIDTAEESLRLARRGAGDPSRPWLARMDAQQLGFKPASFDGVVCLQNGLAVFDAEPARVVAEALRVTCPGGRVLFACYAPAFWEPRLEWFRLQARAGLLGELDETATGHGVIVCRDGFRAGTIAARRFRGLAEAAGCGCRLCEVDGSSLFCELTPSGSGPDA
jgi:2-polyprenyl-6-hydroxyphenyl methylase/3-demethylubiquinone-9 3-methyltransferase